MIDQNVKTFGDAIIEGPKTFRRLIVRKSDGTAVIKAGDGFDGVEVSGGIMASGKIFGSNRTSDNRWQDIYATNGTIQTSDATDKKQVKTLTSKEYDLLMSLRPVSFKWKDHVIHAKKNNVSGKVLSPAYRKTHNRKHHGIIAQELEQAILDVGLTTNDVAALVKDKKTGKYGVRPTELIPLLIDAVQRLDKRVKTLEDRIKHNFTNPSIER